MKENIKYMLKNWTAWDKKKPDLLSYPRTGTCVSADCNSLYTKGDD